MIVLRVVPAIGDKSLGQRIRAHALEKRLELIDIGSRPHATVRGQNQMRVTVDDDRKLGESPVLGCLIDVWRSGSTRDEVPARSIQREAGRIGGGEFDIVRGVAGVDRWPSVIMKCLDRLGEQFANQRIGKQTSFGFLQRREVWRLVQSQRFTQQRPVLENRNDTAVIGAEELPQDEAGEELSELKIVATVSMAIPWQRPVADGQRNRRHPPW